MVRVTVYGGIDEVGGNKILVEEDGTRVFLDFGMSFKRQQMFFDEYLQPRPVLRDLLKLGVLPAIDGIYRDDLVRPDNWEEALRALDWPETYWSAPVRSAAEAGGPTVDAVVLTHAHADHANHIAYLDPRIPVYCSPVTRVLVRAISDVSKGRVDGEFFEMSRRGFEATKEEGTAAFPGAWGLRRRRPVIPRRYEARPELEPFQIGSLTFRLVPVDHSVPGACAVLVKARSGRSILYTGDIRFHGRLVERQAALRQASEGLAPDLLISEGTRIHQEAKDTEAFVEQKVTEEVRRTTGLAMAEFGWKDTTRFDTLQRVASATGRTLVVSPKLAYLLRALKDEVGAPFRRIGEHGNVRTYLDRRRSLLYSPTDYAPEKYTLGEAVEWGDRKPRDWTKEEKDVYLAHLTGGARATEIRRDPARFILTLSFFEMADLNDLEPPSGSTFLRCQCEPFNDEMVLDVAKQRNWLRSFGINEAAGGEVLSVHASGHAGGDDLKAFIRQVAPTRLLPVHTTHPDEFQGLCKDVVDWGPRPGEPVVIDL